jgi:hypothetical protein
MSFMRVARKVAKPDLRICMDPDRRCDRIAIQSGLTCGAAATLSEKVHRMLRRVTLGKT